MKQIRLFLSLLILLGTCSLSTHAQNMIVQKKTNIEYAKLLSSLQTLVFANGNVLINYKGDSTETYGISDIRKLYLKDVVYITNVDTSSTDDVDSTFKTVINTIAKGITIYPNPAGDYIHITNLSENASTISIYRMDGVMVLQTEASSIEASIDISNLPKGLYLVKVNNLVSKFCKL